MVTIRWINNDRFIDPLVHLADDDDSFGESICGWNFRLTATPIGMRLHAKLVNETPTCLWCVAGVRA